MEQESHYKILKGNRILGYGFPIIISTCTTTHDPRLRFTERFLIFIPDAGTITVKGDRDGYTNISQESLSDEVIQKSCTDIAKAEADLKLFESRDSLKEMGVPIPYNAEFSYSDISLQDFLTLAIRLKMGDVCDNISANTLSAQLQQDMNYRLSYYNWVYQTTNIISEPEA